jgi:hypothetical protein
MKIQVVYLMFGGLLGELERHEFMTEQQAVAVMIKYHLHILADLSVTTSVQTEMS